MQQYICNDNFQQLVEWQPIQSVKKSGMAKTSTSVTDTEAIVTLQALLDEQDQQLAAIEKKIADLKTKIAQNRSLDKTSMANLDKRFHSGESALSQPIELSERLTSLLLHKIPEYQHSQLALWP